MIDAFAERLYDNLRATEVNDLSSLKSFIQSELLDFDRNETASYTRKERKMRFVIGARHSNLGVFDVWVSAASRLHPVKKHALVGFEDMRYEYVAESMYRSEVPLVQGVFLGLHVMSIAESTSNFVKAPVSVVLLGSNGLTLENQELINDLQDRVKLFESQFDNLFLACPDTGLQPEEFIAKIREFNETVFQLRKDYTEAVLGDELTKGVDTINERLNLIPPGTMVSFLADALKNKLNPRRERKKIWKKRFASKKTENRNILTF